MNPKPETIDMAVDLETGGLDAGQHEILEIGVVHYWVDEEGDYKIGETFESLVRPTRPDDIHPKALEKNGLKIEDLMKAPTPAQVRNAFFNWHEELFDGKLIKMLGSNPGFDKEFLKLYFGLNYDKIFWYKQKDTNGFAEGLRDSGLLDVSSTSLEALADHFNIPHTAHRAIGDCIAAIRVWEAMVNLTRR